MINDYSISILTEQRRQDFMAEAANDRLARIATAGRPSWWRRLARTICLLYTSPSPRDRS